MDERISSVLDQKGRGAACTEVFATVFDAVARMNAERIGALVVTDGERVVGIFTERHALMRVLVKGLDPHATPVGEVMTRNPITISSRATVGEAMRVVTEHRCRHLPVVDGTALRGLISVGDLASWFVHAHAA